MHVIYADFSIKVGTCNFIRLTIISLHLQVLIFFMLNIQLMKTDYTIKSIYESYINIFNNVINTRLFVRRFKIYSFLSMCVTLSSLYLTNDAQGRIS